MDKKLVDIRDMPTDQSGIVPADSVLGIKFAKGLIVFGHEMQSADFLLDQYMTDSEGPVNILNINGPLFFFGVHQNIKSSVMLNQSIRDYVKVGIKLCLQLFHFSAPGYVQLHPDLGLVMMKSVKLFSMGWKGRNGNPMKADTLFC